MKTLITITLSALLLSACAHQPADKDSKSKAERNTRAEDAFDQRCDRNRPETDPNCDDRTTTRRQSQRPLGQPGDLGNQQGLDDLRDGLPNTLPQLPTRRGGLGL